MYNNQITRVSKILHLFRVRWFEWRKWRVHRMGGGGLRFRRKCFFLDRHVTQTYSQNGPEKKRNSRPGRFCQRQDNNPGRLTPVRGLSSTPKSDQNCWYGAQPSHYIFWIINNDLHGQYWILKNITIKITATCEIFPFTPLPSLPPKPVYSH